MALEGVDSTYLLTKDQGGLTHGGGSQIVFGSDEYETLSTYLGLVTGGGSSTPTSDFWEGVGLLDNKQTLRKAALIFGGRLPTDAEYASVADNKDSSLKVAIRKVMQGDGFHYFLTVGANDKLLTEKFKQLFPVFLDPFPYWPIAANRHYQSIVDGTEAETFEPFHGGVVDAFVYSAPKLIAHVVENESPILKY